MRIISFQTYSGVRPGVLIDDDNVLDFRHAAELKRSTVYRSVLALIEAGDRGLESIAGLLNNPPGDQFTPSRISNFFRLYQCHSRFATSPITSSIVLQQWMRRCVCVRPSCRSAASRGASAAHGWPGSSALECSQPRRAATCTARARGRCARQ